MKRIEGWFDVAWFRRKQPKQPPKIVRNFTGQPKRYGKKRLPTRKTGGAQRRFDKKQSKLRKSGYVMASKKPINHLTDQEFRKFNKRITSGKYEVRRLLAPPKWVGEPPREYVRYRKK